MPLPKDCIIYKCGLCEAHDLFLSCISIKCLINSNHFYPLDSGMAANITFHVTGCICLHLGLHGEASCIMWMHSTEENSKGSSSMLHSSFTCDSSSLALYWLLFLHSSWICLMSTFGLLFDNFVVMCDFHKWSWLDKGDWVSYALCSTRWQKANFDPDRTLFLEF
jgi:hypothetical protein